jgi:DNA-binding beta-propeller fold protein YncE
MNFGNSIGLVALIATAGLVPAARADNDHDKDSVSNAVYIHSNNPLPGKNSVLAYHRNPATGALTAMSGSPFLTGGTGYLNASEVLGPDDTDYEIVATPDHRFLYVTNQGSNTIAGFAVQSDGSLRPVPGSPFPSGGVEPCSIGIDGALMFVVNRGDQAGANPGTHKPNYASFLILPEGSLLPLPWPEPSMVLGASPTTALVAPGGALMFDSHLFENPFPVPGFPPFVPPFSSELHSYKVSPFGQLTAAGQTAPAFPPTPPFILGLQVHPAKKILYAGYVVASLLATYTYDDAGNTTLVGTTAGAPNGGLCWIAISPDAKTLYTADAITDQIDVYSIGADPLHPVLAQTVNLGGMKNPANFNLTGTFWDTTPFQLKTSPDGAYLYVVNHEVSNLTGGNATGNTMHTLKIGMGGTLTEIPSSPLTFPLNEVPIDAHPLGVVVF